MTEEFLRFLKKTKYSKEFDLFLEQYQKANPGRFAIIKISGAVLENELESISEDIAFLYKLNLIPIIVHGAGKSLDQVVSNNKINGIRVTSYEDMYKVKETTNSLTDKLIDEIYKFGAKAVNLSDCLQCDYLDYQIYGYVGKVNGINYNKIMNAINNGFIPIFSNVGICEDTKPLNINADSVAQSLFNHFKPMRLFFITDTGGVLDDSGKIIQHININDEFNANGGMLFKLNIIKDIILEHPDSAIVITSAQSLIKEIFTIKGSGTFISNFKINKYISKENIDFNRLKVLIDSAFNKSLVDNYFNDEFLSFYIHSDYQAVGIIKSVEHYNYLCKFAVSPSHQGVGLAKYLWDVVSEDNSVLVWRSKVTNLANNFYNKRCDGFVKANGWHIYWYGTKYLSAELIEKISNIKQSFC